MTCEDAPCCGCCGTNLYGVRQDDYEGPPYCDWCGYNHLGECRYEDDPDEPEYEERDDAPGCPRCYLATGETVGMLWDVTDEQFVCLTHDVDIAPLEPVGDQGT